MTERWRDRDRDRFSQLLVHSPDDRNRGRVDQIQDPGTFPRFLTCMAGTTTFEAGR